MGDNLVKDTPPPPHVRKTKAGLMPVDRYAAECMGQAAIGDLFKLTPTKGRSKKQLGWYWVALAMVAEATGQWPTKKHVHRDVKRALGYVSKRIDPFTGEEVEEVDSISFDEMDHHEFTHEYLPQVKRIFLEQMGIDLEEMMK